MGRIRVAVGVVVSLFVTAFVTVPAQPASAALPSWATVAAKYAPELRFSAFEEYWPVSVPWLLDRSALRYNVPNSSPATIATIGTINAAMLGSTNPVPYLYYAHGAYQISSACTRPYQANSTRCTRPAGLSLSEGFFLDIANTARAGVVSTSSSTSVYTGSPVYYEHGPLPNGYSYLTFWFAYAYDHYNIPFVGDQYHEGDWERLSIRLDANRNPVTVAFKYHDCDEIKVSWTNTNKVGSTTHPFAYVAKDSHGLYPTSQPIPLCNAGGAIGAADQLDMYGKRWDTWNNMTDVANVGWFGFGGAWGIPNTAPLSNPYLHDTDMTGPMGPGSHKDPSPWDEQ